MNKVSIVMPCFNAGKFIEEAIQSVLRQTYKNIELIIINDGSQDDTEGVVKRYLFDKRIIYIFQNNNGVAFARNKGIRLASGDFIAFLDADDIWFRDKIEKQVEYLMNYPEVHLVHTHKISFNSYGFFPPKGYHKKSVERLKGYIYEDLLSGNWICTSSVVVRKTVFDKVGYFNQDFSLAEDWDLWLRIARLYKIGFIPEVLIYYRDEETSISKNIHNYEKAVFRVVEKHISNINDEVKKKKIYEKALSYCYFNIGNLCLRKGEFKNARRYYLKIRTIKFHKLDPLYYRFLIKTILGEKITIFLKRLKSIVISKPLAKLKLLFVIPNLAGGGAERITLDLISDLPRDKFNVCLVLLNKQGRYNIPENIEKVYNLNKKSRWSFPILVLKLLGIFYKETPSLVFSVLDASHLVVFFAKTLSLIKIPWIIADHSIQSMAIGEQNFAKIKKLIMKKAYSIADKVITVSEAVKNDLVTNFNARDEKISVIYNFVNFDRIKEIKDEIVEHRWFKEDIPIVISVGRFVKVKGHKYLLEAFKEVIKITQCRLVLIGWGPDEENLKQYAQDLNIEKDVLFLPFQKNPWKYISRSTIFVFPSLWEGLPLVLLEAMYCGVPVVGTNCGGVPEIIRNQQLGLIVPPANVEALTEAILLLLKKPELRKRISKDALEFVLNHFDKKKFIKKYEQEIMWTARYGII